MAMPTIDLPPPRPEAFGLTAEEVGRAPCSFVGAHRRGLLVAVYAGLAVTVFVVILVGTRSLGAAAYLSMVVVAAGSIVLVPLIVCGVCLGERAEVAWLCRRFPKMQAVVAYRRALERHLEATGEQPANPPIDWRSVDRLGLREAVRARLEAAGCAVSVAADPAADGYDLEVRRPDGAVVLVGCFPGRRPAGSAVVRLLLGAWTATGARHAVLVAPAGAAPDLVPNPALTITDLEGLIGVCA